MVARRNEHRVHERARRQHRRVRDGRRRLGSRQRVRQPGDRLDAELVARRRPAGVHRRSRRQLRGVLDERRRLESDASDEQPGLRLRAGLVAGWLAHHVQRRSPAGTSRSCRWPSTAPTRPTSRTTSDSTAAPTGNRSAGAAAAVGHDRRGRCVRSGRSEVGSVDLLLADDDTPVDDLVISLASTNEDVLPIENVAVDGSGEQRTLTVETRRRATGVAVVTISGPTASPRARRRSRSTPARIAMTPSSVRLAPISCSATRVTTRCSATRATTCCVAIDGTDTLSGGDGADLFSGGPARTSRPISTRPRVTPATAASRRCAPSDAADALARMEHFAPMTVRTFRRIALSTLVIAAVARRRRAPKRRTTVWSTGPGRSVTRCCRSSATAATTPSTTTSTSRTTRWPTASTRRRPRRSGAGHPEPVRVQPRLPGPRGPRGA